MTLPHRPPFAPGAGSELQALGLALRFMPKAVRETIERSEVARRFLRLATWSLVAFALDKLAMIAIVFLLARILGAADYGRLTLVQGLVNTAQIFVVLGAGTMLARYVPAMREESFRRAVEIVNLCMIVVFTTSLVLTMSGLAIAPIIAADVLEVPTYSPLPYAVIFWVLLTAANNLLTTTMLSFEKGSSMGLVSLIAAFASIILVPAFANRFGLVGAVCSLGAVELIKAAVLSTIYYRMLAMAGVPILTPVRRSDIPLLWRFGLPVFLNSAVWAPTIWLAQLIIKATATDGLIAVGVFGFANSLLGAVILVSSLSNRAALPIQSSLYARGEHAELRRLSWKMTLFQAGAAAALAVPVGLMAPIIMASAGIGFAPYWPVLIITILAAVIIAGQTTLGNYILVIGRPYFIFFTLLPWAAVLLGTCAIFGQHGAYALAWGLLAASTVRTILFMWGWLGPYRYQLEQID